MVTATLPFGTELERLVNDSTGRRVRNLSIECRPDRVVLRGQVASYYVKQLAQHGVCSALPETFRLENAIVVTKS
jgi:hypothetical protein